MKCITCGKTTNNPKFCSRSCSAISTNKAVHRRKLTRRCRGCNKLVRADRMYCPGCIQLGRHKSGHTHISLARLDTYSKGTDANRYCSIRANAKICAKVLPNKCAVCGYDKHVQVAHIKSISQFPPDTLVATINDIRNLIKLCPNHHWELDHGQLRL